MYARLTPFVIDAKIHVMYLPKCTGDEYDFLLLALLRVSMHSCKTAWYLFCPRYAAYLGNHEVADVLVSESRTDIDVNYIDKETGKTLKSIAIVANSVFIRQMKLDIVILLQDSDLDSSAPAASTCMMT